MTKFFCFTMCIFIFANTAHGVCFQDQRSYESVEQQLPTIMKQKAVVLIHQSRNLLAGIRIYAVGAIFRIESHIWHAWLGLDQEDHDVSQICYQDGQAKITLTSGKMENIKIDGKKIQIKGYEFVAGTDDDLGRVIEDISMRTSRP